MATMPNGMTTGSGDVHVPIWETKLPFEIAPGDGALIAKAMRAYRPDTSEEEAVVNFLIDQFAKLDEKE